MSSWVKQYMILLSAPSDVIEEMQVIHECIDEFNRVDGVNRSINLLPQYWKEDSYPGHGKEPQAILNRQIVDKCDAIITVFKTRFGSPTEKYDSGTEEEIARFVEKRKEVFLYFHKASKEINHSNHNDDQLIAIEKFKKKISKTQIYYEYESIAKFKSVLLKHLRKFFITNEESLKAKNLLENKGIRSLIHGILKDDYSVFEKAILQNISDGHDEKNNMDYYMGAVTGLYTIHEAFIAIGENENIYILLLYNQTIKYFTNDEQNMDKIPNSIAVNKWLENKQMYDFIYLASLPKERLKFNAGTYKRVVDASSVYTATFSENQGKISFLITGNYGGHVARAEGTFDLIDNYLGIYLETVENKLNFMFLKNKVIVKEKGSFGGSKTSLQGHYIRVE
jgi:hypothetical protein